MSDLAILDHVTTPTEPHASEAVEAHLQLLTHSTEPKKIAHGSRVPAERKATIYALHDAGKLNAGQIAERLGMNWATVAAILAHREIEPQLALNALGANSLPFVKDWILASRVGSKKGRHQPAMDALERLGVVSAPEKTGANINIAIVLGQPTER